MAEYIDIDTPLELKVVWGNTFKPYTSTLRELLDTNHIPYTAADVRPVVRGKWIDRDDKYYGWNMWACSACGEEFVLTEGTPDMNEYHFCPNCGADMRPQPPKEE